MSEVELSPGQLARSGFLQTARAASFLQQIPELSPASLDAFAATADPDQALLSLLRIREAAPTKTLREILSDLNERPDKSHAGPGAGERLLRLLGVSQALGDFLVRHPETLPALTSENASLRLDEAPETVRADLLSAVGADPQARIPVAALSGREGMDALRIAYYRRLLQIALLDASQDEPELLQPGVSAAIADLAGAALDAALALARKAVPGQEKARLAVIAMGKTGARELNYISDVDVIYVAAPEEGCDEEEALAVATGLARELSRICAEKTAEGSLWQVDANLRPEGKDGPLVRTLESCRRYYAKWAKSWEFQALLKARAVAGDIPLGNDFVALVQPAVWQAATREGFVEDTRAMRKRVVAHIPAGEAQRNIKLGPGGLRDVEFTVQLLQMVHGRNVEALRERGTLDAIMRLSEGGFISRENAAELSAAYRFLRSVEHRVQLQRMKRLQVLPTAEKDLRRLARCYGLLPDEFNRRYEATRRRVRHLHEEIFYRPLLMTAASLDDGVVTLTPDAARDRLAAIGYRDPAKAVSHIAALSSGLSRRAAIQRQLLPGFLEWFAEGVDPDLGLLNFRRLSEVIGSAHWYMALLRDSGNAARRLTMLLSSSRFIGQQLERLPEAVRWLASDTDLRPLSAQQLRAEFASVLERVSDPEEKADVLRRTRSRELLRLALSHLCLVSNDTEVASALTDVAACVLDAALSVVKPAAGVEVAVIALGSFGAREMGYSSDADVQFVVRGGDGATDEGVRVASELQRLLNAPTYGADMKVNADLRPEGRNGILARSYESWCEYYLHHAELWEKQALLRAYPAAGSEALCADIAKFLDTVRYPANGLNAAEMRQVRRMKARLESERLPRGVAPRRHLKLGPGATTDVEWVAQILQLRHAHRLASLRVTTTARVLRAAVQEGLLTQQQEESLNAAWHYAWRCRRANYLWRGRASDVLPPDRHDLNAIAQLLEVGSGSELEEEYLRITRHARQLVEQLFFEATP
ncbi:bifunctional [glutamine synthetase] adenylyltransferase/[glutamine synthetase]-adenylyl-L-tyrosine phosphorylase [Dermabacteraceae bacterium CCM 9519]